MKNIAGKIIGFTLGFIGFLFLYKIIFLENIPPTDEIAPGIVIIAAIFSGIILSYTGSLFQDLFIKKH